MREYWDKHVRETPEFVEKARNYLQSRLDQAGDNHKTNENRCTMKFGKTIGDVIEFKTDFFKHNKKLL